MNNPTHVCAAAMCTKGIKDDSEFCSAHQGGFIRTKETPKTETMIRVWRFHEAPQEYQELSGNGGDEDWLALVPKSMAESYISWLDDGSSFGVYCIDRFTLKSGEIIVIGSHS